MLETFQKVSVWGHMANKHILRSRNYATLYLKIYSKNFFETWSLSGCSEKRKMPYFEKTIFQKIPLWCKWSIQAQFWAKVKETSAKGFFWIFVSWNRTKGRQKGYNWNFQKSLPFRANTPFPLVLAQHYGNLISQDPLWELFSNYASSWAGHWILDSTKKENQVSAFGSLKVLWLTWKNGIATSNNNMALHTNFYIWFLTIWSYIPIFI